MLKVEDLHFSYNGKPVLQGIDFELECGQTMAVLGVNGAGKSTMLRCLNRVLKPKRATVYIDGQSLAGLSGAALARRMGYVPQERAQCELTVREMVMLGRKPHMKWGPTAKDEQVVDSVIKRMRIQGLAHRLVDRLSGGEAQKVVMARALAQEPEVLLLDEPTSNLDLRNQLELMDQLTATVKKDGLCAVVCLHDLNLAMRHMDRLLLMKDGKVHTLAGPDELSPAIIRDVYSVDVQILQSDSGPVIVPVQALGE